MTTDAPPWTDYLRSSVRPMVTYLVITAYVLVTSYAVYWLFQEGQSDNALALLSGLSGIATGIVGFWFGTRGQGGLKAGGSAEGASNQEAAPNAAAAAGVSLANALSEAEITRARQGEQIPITGKIAGPPERELQGNLSSKTDGTLLFFFMDETIDGRLVQLQSAVTGTLPSTTTSVPAGTTLSTG